MIFDAESNRKKKVGIAGKISRETNACDRFAVYRPVDKPEVMDPEG